MAFEDLFGDFEYKNTELGSLADFSYEVCVTTAREQSAGTTMGLDQHAMGRQRAYIQNARDRLAGLAGRPMPDLPAVHPMTFMTTQVPPELISVDGKPLNTDAVAVAQMWQMLSYELLKSNSAGLGGGMTVFDANRCAQNISSVEQFLIAIEEAGDVDFPETASPEAKPGGAKKK